jgi:hypothetical protein
MSVNKSAALAPLPDSSAPRFPDEPRIVTLAAAQAAGNINFGERKII